MKFVAVFRAYDWDATIDVLARRFFAACPGVRHVVMVDETRGPVEIGDYEKISHTSDTSLLGLPAYPSDNPLWFNVDYGIYFAVLALPGYDYYIFSESDLAINVSLERMIAEIAEREIDFVAHMIRPATQDWYWLDSGAQYFPAPWRALLFFMALSAPAIDMLLAARQRLAAEFEAHSSSGWPFCELFVPSALKLFEGFKLAEMSEFGVTTNLKYRPRLSINDPRANEPGTFAHSVLAANKFIVEQTAKFGLADLLYVDSELRESLRYESLDQVAQILGPDLVTQRDHVGLFILNREFALRNQPAVSYGDLAFCKPARSSSVGPWSHFQDPTRDAAGANSVTLPEDFGFHTNLEIEPWWMVDLLEEFAIDEIRIVNRRQFPDRFRIFSIEGSRDGTSWITRLTKFLPDPISSDDATPWCHTWLDPFVARFVRVRSLEHTVLHLRRVEIFGRLIVPSAAKG